MICRRRLISGIIIALIFVGAVRADMVPVSKVDTGRQPPLRVCGQAKAHHTNHSNPYDHPIIVDLHLGTVQLQSEAGVEIVQPAPVPHVLELTGGAGSVSLCLYALMGFGLCSAPHWIKRLHFGNIPEWYHEGGPFQIGHSLVVSPESFCPVPVYCFVQPDDTVEELIPRYRLRTIVSSLRKSQFASETIASRGPPLCSCREF